MLQESDTIITKRTEMLALPYAIRNFSSSQANFNHMLMRFKLGSNVHLLPIDLFVCNIDIIFLLQAAASQAPFLPSSPRSVPHTSPLMCFPASLA